MSNLKLATTDELLRELWSRAVTQIEENCTATLLKKLEALSVKTEPHAVQVTEIYSSTIYPWIEQQTRSYVDTATAAFYLSKRPQTLRAWASTESKCMLVRPQRIGGRLAWPVEDIRKILEGKYKPNC